MSRGGRRDATDRRILDLLVADARQPTIAIARKLGLPRTTVQERILRLERGGVILGYRAVLTSDPEILRLQSAVLLSIRQRQQGEVVRRLSALPEVKSCFSISGEFDLMLIAEAPLSEDLDAVIDEITSIEAVERSMSLIVLAKKFARDG